MWIPSRARKLCRLLGFGLLSVTTTGRVDLLAPAGAYRPRSDPRRRARYLREHESRVGDPAVGGSTRQPIMTAYRQRSLACAAAMAERPARPRDLRPIASDAPAILLRNVYGWFDRVDRGLYALTDRGRAALGRWPAA